MIQLLARANGHDFDCLCFHCEGKRIVATYSGPERRKVPRAAAAPGELALLEDVLGAEKFPYGR